MTVLNVLLKPGSAFFAAVRSQQHYQNFVQVLEQDRKNIQACVNQEIRK